MCIFCLNYFLLTDGVYLTSKAYLSPHWATCAAKMFRNIPESLLGAQSLSCVICRSGTGRPDPVARVGNNGKVRVRQT